MKNALDDSKNSHILMKEFRSPLVIAFYNKKFVYLENHFYNYDFSDGWFRNVTTSHAEGYGLALKDVKFSNYPKYDEEIFSIGLDIIFMGKYLPSREYEDDPSKYEVAKLHLWISPALLKEYGVVSEDTYKIQVKLIAKDFQIFVRENQHNWIP